VKALGETVLSVKRSEQAVVSNTCCPTLRVGSVKTLFVF
jgi:hypothetical protein